MSYTVISEGTDAPLATVVENVLEALNLAHDEARKGKEIAVTTDSGWFLTLDQLEELVKQ